MVVVGKVFSYGFTVIVTGSLPITPSKQLLYIDDLFHILKIVVFHSN